MGKKLLHVGLDLCLLFLCPKISVYATVITCTHTHSPAYPSLALKSISYLRPTSIEEAQAFRELVGSLL